MTEFLYQVLTDDQIRPVVGLGVVLLLLWAWVIWERWRASNAQREFTIRRLENVVQQDADRFNSRAEYLPMAAGTAHEAVEPAGAAEVGDEVGVPVRTRR